MPVNLNSLDINSDLNKGNYIQNKLFNEESHPFIRLALFFILLMWCTGFSLRAIFPHSAEVVIISPILKKLYSSVCYQDDLKSFSIFNEKLFVCIRCTGIYLGALSISFVSIFLKHIGINKKILLAGLSAIISDVVIYTSGIFNYSKFFAFATGFFFGSAAFLYILIILEKEFFNKKY